ncbi:MAG: hypothetical protein ACPG7F_08955 [Aggregatilineales bacterium]
MTESNRIQILSGNVEGLGDPVWSLDGNYLLWSDFQLDNRRTRFTVSDVEGNNLWQTDFADNSVPQLIWADCD